MTLIRMLKIIILVMSLANWASKGICFASSNEGWESFVGLLVFSISFSILISIISGSKKPPSEGPKTCSESKYSDSSNPELFDLPGELTPLISRKLELVAKIKTLVEDIFINFSLLLKKITLANDVKILVYYTYTKVTLFLFGLKSLLSHPSFNHTDFFDYIFGSIKILLAFADVLSESFFERYGEAVHLWFSPVFSNSPDHDWFRLYMDTIFDLIQTCSHFNTFSEITDFFIYNLGYTPVSILLGVVFTTPLVPVLTRLSFLLLKKAPIFLKVLGI